MLVELGLLNRQEQGWLVCALAYELRVCEILKDTDNERPLETMSLSAEVC